MTLCWRATFIDYIPPEAERPRERKRSVSAPAGAPKGFHFGGERSYVSSLAERVGFVPEVSHGGETRAEVSAAMSLSVNALPLLGLRDDDNADSFEEDSFSVAGAVHSLSSLPMWRPCGTASPTMDSLCALEDVPEGTGGFPPKVQACGTAAPTMDSLPEWRPCGMASPSMDSLCALEEYISEGTLGFLPKVHACGTAAPTMDSLCALDDISEDAMGFLPQAQACGTAAPTMESLCALDDISEDAAGCSPRPQGRGMDGPTFPSGRTAAPAMDSLGARGVVAGDFTACCRKDRPQHADSQDVERRLPHNVAAAKPETIPQPVPLRSQGGCGEAYFSPPRRAVKGSSDVPYPFQRELHERPAERGPARWAHGMAEDDRHFMSAEASAPAAPQGPAHAHTSFGFGEGGMRRHPLESSVAFTKERCPRPSAWAGSFQEPRACPVGRGQNAVREAQRQEGLYAGGQHAAPQMPAASDAVSVAIDGGAAMIVIRQHISTPEDVLALSRAVLACLQSSSSISVVFIWANGSQCRPSNFQGLHEYTALQEGLASVTEKMALLPLPVLGFAASGSHCLPSSMLLAACDQVISLVSGTFCVRQGMSVVSARTALELGFVGRLVDDSASLLHACATYRHQLTTCSTDELRRVKMSLKGMRSYFMEEAIPRASKRAAAAPEAQVPAAMAPDAGSMEGGGHGDAEEVTSLMLCNLPCRLSQQQLVDIIESLGFGRKVDHLHFPASKGSANLGYVFVHLASPEDAAAFTTAFRNYRFANCRSKKVPDVRPARLQGRASTAGQRNREARHA